MGTRTVQKLTGQQQAMLLFLKEHPEATRKEICEGLSDITEKGVNTIFPGFKS